MMVYSQAVVWIPYLWLGRGCQSPGWCLVHEGGVP